MIVLCWFLRHNQYNGFRLEELEALVALEGVDPSSLWRRYKRPQSHSEDQFVFISVPNEHFCSKLMQRSLLIKAFLEVSLSLVILANRFRLRQTCAARRLGYVQSIFCSRVAAFFFPQVWAEGETYEDVLKELQLHQMEVFRKWVNDERTWAFKVEAFGRCLSMEDQRAKMNFFAPLFKGSEKVDLANPDTTLSVAEVRCLLGWPSMFHFVHEQQAVL